MRFGSTAKVLAECKLKYYKLSECQVLVTEGTTLWPGSTMLYIYRNDTCPCTPPPPLSPPPYPPALAGLLHPWAGCNVGSHVKRMLLHVLCCTLLFSRYGHASRCSGQGHNNMTVFAAQSLYLDIKLTVIWNTFLLQSIDKVGMVPCLHGACHGCALVLHGRTSL